MSKTKLVTVAPSQFVGKPIRCDVEFVPHIETLNEWAEEFDLKIYVTSSIRHRGAFLRNQIVPPAKCSNHYIGHAIDMNLVLQNGEYITSRVMLNEGLDRLPLEVLEFLHRVQLDPVLRWGGDFSTPDPVHIDDGLNLQDPALWDEKYRIIQAELRGFQQ